MNLQAILSGGRTVNTATALAIILNSSARVLKKSIKNVGLYVINGLIQQVYTWNMLFVDDPSIKGDVRVEASGAVGFLVKEQETLRLIEFANLTRNQMDMDITGRGGRAEVLRAIAAQLPLDADKVVPEPEVAELEGQAQELPVPPGVPQLPAAG